MIAKFLILSTIAIRLCKRPFLYSGVDLPALTISGAGGEMVSKLIK